MAGLAVLSAEGLRNYILEGVDNLRIRKCRPDRETIAHYVLRKYGGTINDIFNELETIVDEGLLLKVEYKGSTSYRTPESFDQKNSPLLTKHSKILNSSRTTRLILTTINDLLVQNPDYCTLGIPLSELKEKLTGQEPERFADNKLDIAFSREVSIGNVLLGDGDRVYPKDIQPKRLQIASNGSPTPAAGDKSADANPAATSDGVKVPKKRGRKSNAERLAIAQAQAAAAASSGDVTVSNADVAKVDTVDAKATAAAAGEAKIEEKVAEAVRKTFDGRVSGRNKIKRKVFDPSDVPTPTPVSKAASSIKKKKRSSSNQDSVDTCEICNRKGDAKNLIICSSCAASCKNLRTYHTTCLGLSKEQQANINLSDWLCSDCRICNACSSPLKSSNHVECVKCKSGFHTVCVGDEEDFICGECVFNKGNVKNGKEQNQVQGQVASQQGQAIPQPVKKRGRPPKIRKVEEPTGPVASVIISPSSITTSAPASQSVTATSPTKSTGTSTEPKSSPAKVASIASSDGPSEKVKEEVLLPKLVPVDSSAPTSSSSASASTSTSASTADPVSPEKKPVVKDEEIQASGTSGQSGAASASASASTALKTEGSQTADNLDDDNNIVDDSIVIGEGKPSDLEAKKCSEWTPADVEKYFNDKGLPEAGTLFREQEVDGLSLLLMKRSDVIFGLRLRLGPALKVYKIILQLQNNLTT